LQHGKSLQIQQKGVITSNLLKFTDKRKKIDLSKLAVERAKTACAFLYNCGFLPVPSQFPVTSQCCRSYNWVINPYRNGTGKVPTQEKIKKSFGFLLT